jgi:uroporphyrinogen decarboxylase
MNGTRRILAAIHGEWPDRTPVMLHNFMMAAREAGIRMRQYREDPRQIARSLAEAAERYGVDGILVDVDTALLAGALGVPVDFPEDAPARVHGSCLRSLEAVCDLAPVDISKDSRVQILLEAVRLLVKHFGGEVLIRGNCDQCPFTLAGYLRAMEEWLMDIAGGENDELAHRLLEYCTQATVQLLRLMAKTGCQMLSNGDSPAGPDMLSPRLYRQFAFPYEQRVAACSRELGLPYLLHICGKTDRILEDLLLVGADGFELDYKTSARRAHDLFKDRVAFVGNIDPSGVLALGTPELVSEKGREVVGIFSDTPRFVLNAGCALPPDTPEANIRALLDCRQSNA